MALRFKRILAQSAGMRVQNAPLAIGFPPFLGFTKVGFVGRFQHPNIRPQPRPGQCFLCPEQRFRRPGQRLLRPGQCFLRRGQRFLCLNAVPGAGNTVPGAVEDVCWDAGIALQILLL